VTESGALNSVACAICSVEDAEHRFDKQGLKIVRCRRCGLMYVNPRLSMDELRELYNAQKISDTSYYERTAKDDAVSFAKRLKLIERHRAPGRLLDIGCGPGTFLALAVQRGWKARGIDVNSTSVERCKAAGLDAIAGTFPHPELAGEKFDAIVLNDVLEHLPEPRAALAAVREMLAPGGVMFVSTPDVGSAVARLARVRWLHLKPVEHLTYFDRVTLRRLLDETGFEVVHCASIGRVRSLALILERLDAYSPAISKLGRALIPKRLARRLSFPVDPGDEMAMLALPRQRDPSA
jgi:2-polyprenyl-3-methyl-5-hydroxy-6-metoxy-1,4-benzoquinol methylase